jgi:hypothetical protein
MAEQQPILYVVTMESEAFQRTVALMLMATMMARQGLKIEFLAVGTGIEIYRNNNGVAPEFEELLNNMRKEKITFAACTNAMKSTGLSKDEMFPIDKFVIGGEEVAARIKDGYMVMTF